MPDQIDIPNTEYNFNFFYTQFEFFLINNLVTVKINKNLYKNLT